MLLPGLFVGGHVKIVAVLVLEVGFDVIVGRAREMTVVKILIQIMTLLPERQAEDVEINLLGIEECAVHIKDDGADRSWLMRGHVSQCENNSLRAREPADHFPE